MFVFIFIYFGGLHRVLVEGPFIVALGLLSI